MFMLPKRHQAGFSLIEVMLAVAITSVIIINILGTFPLILVNVKNNENTINLVVSAQEVMHELMAQNAFIDEDVKKPRIIKDTLNLPASFPRRDGNPLGRIEVWGREREPVAPSTTPSFQIIYVKAILTESPTGKKILKEYTLTGAVSP
jgi:prepilin-type N-terminal cleavage/methylation domain-containing protein